MIVKKITEKSRFMKKMILLKKVEIMKKKVVIMVIMVIQMEDHQVDNKNLVLVKKKKI